MNPAQESLLPQVAHARHADPETSKQAAVKASEHLTYVQRLVETAISMGPACDEVIEKRIRHWWPECRITSQSLRSRRAELVAKGVVRFSGTYDRTSNGGRSRVWELA